jgi:hypothetical protein
MIVHCWKMIVKKFVALYVQQVTCSRWHGDILLELAIRFLHDRYSMAREVGTALDHLS